jgi:hypothetical protein
MKKIACFLVIVSSLLISTGYTFGQPVSKETRNVSDFTAVSFGLAGEVNIKLGSTFQVVLEGDSKYIADVETYVRDGRLIIRRDNNFGFNDQKVNVYITMPEIRSLGMSGSGKALIEGVLKADALNLSVSGSGRITIPEIAIIALDCSISGSGSIYLEGGTAGKADISISGSGSFNAEKVVIKDFKAGISGSGSCSCNVSDNLEAGISGSGNIVYSGNPKINVRASGSGHVRSR